MSGSSSVNTAQIASPTGLSGATSNPASALVSSSHPPLPLAPRLTPAITSQQGHTASLGRHASVSRLNGANDIASTEGASSSSSNSSTLSPSARPPPGPLIHRASLSPATQALNVDTIPPSARFSAYEPRHSPARWQGTLTRDSSQSGFQSHSSSQDVSWKLVARARGKGDSANESADEEATSFEVLPQFKPEAHLPGDVLVRCASSNFYVHRAVLYFASPFFQAVLDGDWKETHPSLHSFSDDGQEDDEETIDTASKLGSTRPQVEGAENKSETSSELGEVGGDELFNVASPRASFHTANITFDGVGSISRCAPSPSEPLTQQKEEHTIVGDTLHLEKCGSLDTLSQQKGALLTAPGEINGRLQRLATPPPSEKGERIMKDSCSKPDLAARDKEKNIVAVIDLSEEAASTFQDFLCLVYPNLDLCVTWNNIFPLFSFSDKFEVPHLRRACVAFLRAALAGRPIEAMALAERHNLEDIYREASRHVLENMPAWDPEELDILCKETLLKLERKRTWFLERLLKLGLANPARDYECHAACPDPQNCARLLHERWRNQYSNAFRYGPPQPSMIWRHLREMESGGSGANLVPPLSACRSSSKAWVQLLFDRMYGLPTHGMTHPKFLFVKLDPDQGLRPRPRVPAEGTQHHPTDML